MNIISEQHKKELLEITENSPADIASLIDYLEAKLQRKIESFDPSQLEDFKFFVMKSFADEINNSKDDNKYIQKLLEELQVIWKDLFVQELHGQHIYTLDICDTTHYTELDFTELKQNNLRDIGLSETSLDLSLIEPLIDFSDITDKQKYDTELDFSRLDQDEKNSYNVQNIVKTTTLNFTQQTLLNNNHNNDIPFPKDINLKEKVNLEILNDLLLLGACNKRNFFESNKGLEVSFKLPNNERLAMKVFSLNNQPILKENKFENAILFLSKKINKNGEVDYSEGFSADIADGKINSSYITPLGEIIDFLQN